MHIFWTLFPDGIVSLPQEDYFMSLHLLSAEMVYRCPTYRCLTQCKISPLMTADIFPSGVSLLARLFSSRSEHRAGPFPVPPLSSLLFFVACSDVYCLFCYPLPQFIPRVLQVPIRSHAKPAINRRTSSLDVSHLSASTITSQDIPGEAEKQFEV
jgi:hypothetical protein